MDKSAQLVCVSSYEVGGVREPKYVRYDLPKVVVAHFAEDDTTRNLTVSWDLSTITGADYHGKTFYSGEDDGSTRGMLSV